MLRVLLFLMVSAGGALLVGCDRSESSFSTSIDAFVRTGDAGMVSSGQSRDMLLGPGGNMPSTPGRDASLPGSGTNLNCEALSDCLRACTDGACSQDCRARATPLGSRAYDAIYTCAAANICNEPGGRYNRDCMNLNCSAELEACYGPPPPPPPPPTGQGTCVELYNCLQQCPDDGTYVCRDNCVRASSRANYDAYTSYTYCLEDAPCSSDDTACRLSACEAETRACFGDVPVPSGTNSCSQYDTCLRACPDNDQDCVGACTRSTSPDGYNQYLAMMMCLRNSGCPNDDAECQRAACPMEIEACIVPPDPMGFRDCPWLYQCILDCPSNDRACHENCFVQSGREGFDLYQAMNVCVNSSGCPAGDADCYNRICGDEIDACLQPEAVGNGTCSQLMQCLQGCGSGNFDCQNGCIMRTSPFGWSLYEAIFDCGEAAGCFDGDLDCIQARCLAQIEACFAN